MKLFLCILSLIIIGACSQKKEYDVTGVILDKFSERNELSIHHDEIPGFMMAMTMNFKLASHLNVNNFEIANAFYFI